MFVVCVCGERQRWRDEREDKMREVEEDWGEGVKGKS